MCAALTKRPLMMLLPRLPSVGTGRKMIWALRCACVCLYLCTCECLCLCACVCASVCECMCIRELRVNWQGKVTLLHMPQGHLSRRLESSL
jgi:hypothetical protein